jgi:hypothetical protein
MPFNNAATMVDPDRDDALALIAGLKMVQTRALSELSARANEASAAGDTVLDLALTRKAIDLSRMNLTIANARRSAQKAKSLSGSIAALAEVTSQAESALDGLRHLATALAAAERLIAIIRRLIGLFG